MTDMSKVILEYNKLKTTLIRLDIKLETRESEKIGSFMSIEEEEGNSFNPVIYINEIPKQEIKDCEITTDFDEFIKMGYQIVEKWKEKHCSNTLLIRKLCEKCFKENCDKDEGWLEVESEDWNEQNKNGEFFCWNLNKYQLINRPCLEDCPYKLEHLLNSNNLKKDNI